MRSRSAGANSSWVMFAIPAAVVVVLVSATLIILAVRPAKKPAEETLAAPEAAPRSPEIVQPAPVETSEAPPTPPTAVEATPKTPTATALPRAPRTTPRKTQPPVATTVPVALVAPSTPSPPLITKAAPLPIDLLASLDLNASPITGEWRKDGAVIRCANATAKNRAKLRLVPPPDGGYDFAVTFTVQGERRMVAQVLSFRGKQFIFAMFPSQSGFASVKGQNALGNETTKKKGITAGTKHTSVVKVRDREVSAYLDGELLSTYATDYSDLDVSDAWNVGMASARESVLGLAVECPVTVEAITLTPLEAQPATAPAAPPAPSYKDLAAMISTPFSSDSSAAATQPSAKPRMMSADALQSLVAASQPVISDVAADLSAATRPAGIADDNAAARDALFRSVQISISPAVIVADPLLESLPVEAGRIAVDRAEFDAEQFRIAEWRKLIGRMSELYPNAKSQSDVVKLQLADAAGANKGKPVSFFATNSSSDPLTNVTLAIEIVHVMTSPSPTAIHYYFIPRWQAGQKIFFSAACIPNVPSRELLDFPTPALPSGLPGLIEARAQLWSDKVSQANQTTRFDANFQAIARAQLNDAYRLVDEALRRPAAASRPAGAGTGQPTASTPPTRSTVALVVGPIIPARTDLDADATELARARAAASRALALLPAQAPLIDDAKSLAAQPINALRERRKRQVDAFIDALELRSSRPGAWVIHKPGALAKLVKPADRDAALAAAGAAGGRLILTIDSRTNDGSAIAVTLTSADQPDLRRKFTGRFQVDGSTSNRLLLNLRATQPSSSKPPAEADLKRVVQWNSLLLELRGNTLCGIATAGPTDTATVLNVAFAPPVAAAPSPTPGRSSPPPRPRPTTTRAK